MRLVTNLTKLATGIEDDMKLEKKNYKSIALIFIITSVLILIDQYVKYIADTNLKLYEYNPVIGDIFGIEYCRNEGIAWGMFQGKVNFITILTSIITVVMIWFIFHIELYINHLKEKISSDTEEKNTANTDIYKRIKTIKILEYTVSVIIAGAIGNLIDRISRKYVIDFFYIKIINFPIFNIADIYVTLAMVLLFVLVLIKIKEEDINALFKSKNKWD